MMILTMTLCSEAALNSLASAFLCGQDSTHAQQSTSEMKKRVIQTSKVIDMGSIPIPKIKLDFGKSFKLLNFQVRESPAPLSMPTPTLAPCPLRSGRGLGRGPGLIFASLREHFHLFFEDFLGEEDCGGLGWGVVLKGNKASAWQP